MVRVNIQLELYAQTLKNLPKTGQHIIAHQTHDLLVVYQAYKPAIAAYAVKNQILGGSDFSYNRMSWIKPNFLWMMYRCGWAEKENQERVLAWWIAKSDFEEILSQAVMSSFDATYYENYEQWKNDLNTSDVRLQWDPDHDPFGNKLQRRAIQLGLKGNALEKFGKEQIKKIEDIADFVRQQKLKVDSRQLDELLVPVETILQINDQAINAKIGIDQ